MIEKKEARLILGLLAPPEGGKTTTALSISKKLDWSKLDPKKPQVADDVLVVSCDVEGLAAQRANGIITPRVVDYARIMLDPNMDMLKATKIMKQQIDAEYEKGGLVATVFDTMSVYASDVAGFFLDDAFTLKEDGRRDERSAWGKVGDHLTRLMRYLLYKDSDLIVCMHTKVNEDAFARDKAGAARRRAYKLGTGTAGGWEILPAIPGQAKDYILRQLREVYFIEAKTVGGERQRTLYTQHPSVSVKCSYANVLETEYDLDSSFSLRKLKEFLSDYQ